jgi:two-component system chemotaxis sensor kinase CheA
MAAKKKRSFSSIKEWINTNKITVINVTVSIFLVSLVIFVLLGQARTQTMQVAEENMVNLTGAIARDAQTYLLTKLDAIRSIAQMIGSYENIDIEQRRAFIRNTLQEGLALHSGIRDIYAIWRPNELDGLDYRFANTEDHDETGQFISGFTSERGWIEPRLFSDYRNLLEINFEDYFGFGVERIGEPRPGFAVNPFGTWRTDHMRDFTWIADIWIPILSDASRAGAADVVAVVGATFHLERLQVMCEDRLPYGTGRILMSSDGGVVIAHQDAETRGINILDPDTNNTMFSNEDYDRLRGSITASMAALTPNIVRATGELVVTYPLNTTTTLQTLRTHGVRSNPPWALVTIVPLSTIMAPINRMMLVSVLFIIGAGIVMAFVLFTTSRSLTTHATNLQRSLEHSSTMQDNLKYGLFLVDKNYIIQGAYSKALEKILSIDNLQGKSLIELFSASLKEVELQSFADYLEMVFKDSFDKETLENINPVNEFSYLNAETGERKNLRTSFTMAEQGTRSAYILGIMEDITAEKELENQLKEAESLRENEMRSLFQVIQLDPRVLRDFVADAEYEFERINDALKNKRHLQKDVLADMYQSVHAIKSNALILNLESFSERLHKLESSVKNLQEADKKVVLFDDFLSLVLELNDAMIEIDQLQATVSKIENFKTVSGGDKNQDRYVLVETLTQVCSKTQAALDKKVNFVVEEIDDAALDYGPRRAIKEILTQLIRNAVYHGIESPEERTPLGKTPEGEIRLSIKCSNDQIIIKLTDNGAGINFGQVRQTATASKLLASPGKANDKKFLLNAIFSPGFTTLDDADLHAGRGVGLSLVRERVKDMHGNIVVTTAAGKGTSFTISIPIELPAADHAS